LILLQVLYPAAEFDLVLEARMATLLVISPFDLTPKLTM
jgi:hypothetical protein